MSVHTFQLTGETETDAVFTCALCGFVLGFNKPGVGEPCAVSDGAGGWVPPENPDQWGAPCSTS